MGESKSAAILYICNDLYRIGRYTVLVVYVPNALYRVALDRIDP